MSRNSFAKTFRDERKEAQARSKRAADVRAGRIRCVMAWRWQNLRPEEDLRLRRGRDTEICPSLCTHCYQPNTEVDPKKGIALGILCSQCPVINTKIKFRRIRRRSTGSPCGIYLVEYTEVLVPDACLLWYEQLASRVCVLSCGSTSQYRFCIADTDQTIRSRPCIIVIQIRRASPGLDVEGRLNGEATSYAVTPRIANDSDHSSITLNWGGPG
ncbi:hypothetical protein BC835DRAFT_1361010 [Cytidiella melzeri]|nr:hypothetical protein BC835DRAFT_1361010 [Cytidiella melzeri]